MTSISPADIVVLRFPFAEQNAVKARPAVVISTSEFRSARGDLIEVAWPS